MSTRFRRAGLLAAALLIGVSSACNTERASAPATVAAPASAPSRDLVGGLLGTVTNTLKLTKATGLLRTTPLPAPITVTRTIGYWGGTLAIPEAGVTVVVPVGALSKDTQISMTARAGSLVAYDFEPHGVTFAKPLAFTQSLRGTNVSLLTVLQLKLGYYSDPGLLGQTTAIVSELVSGVGSLLTWTFTAPIRHFSGYIVLTGFADE
ncbi:MAG TPA: hypothetical protein VFN38_08390 [Gemmatimonadaceae bacterium]|nr:hypothetical protein [Gemmatimonadaceae bacterium]